MTIKFAMPDKRFIITKTEAKLTEQDVRDMRHDRGALYALLVDGEYHHPQSKQLVKK